MWQAPPFLIHFACHTSLEWPPLRVGMVLPTQNLLSASMCPFLSLSAHATANRSVISIRHLTDVCKTEITGQHQFLGARRSWRAGADCKSVVLRLRWFESTGSHQMSVLGAPDGLQIGLWFNGRTSVSKTED